MTYYIYRLKRLARNRTAFFWAIVFPVALATLFKMAFGDVTKKDWAFQTIPVAVVSGETKDVQLVSFLEGLKNGEQNYFSVVETDSARAEELLRKQEIKAVIKNDGEISLIFSENGLMETIVKEITDCYLQSREMILEAAGNGTLPIVAEQFTKEFDTISEREFAGASKDPMISFFQALLAMASLYGAIFGIMNTQELTVGFVAVASRRLSAPLRKFSTVVADVAAAFTIQYAQFLLLIAYYVLILKLDFGDVNGWLFVAGAIHSLLGVAYGYFVGCLVQKSERMQMAIMVGTAMFSCFLAGLMTQSITVKIEASCPVVNRINPATLIVNSYQSLCVMRNMDKFMDCLIRLGIWCAILIFGSIGVLALRQNVEKWRKEA